MASLEGELNKKASVLSNVNADVSKKQQEQDEEYVLGLLNLHRNDWSVEQQLNATKTFMHNSPVLQDFYKNHDAKKPLVPQLAALMDAAEKERSGKASKAVEAAPAKPTKASKAERIGKA